jgi:hypothetical protein
MNTGNSGKNELNSSTNDINRFKNIKNKIIKILIINYYKNKYISISKSTPSGIQDNIKIDESRKYIPKKLFKNDTTIVRIKEWYKYIDWGKYKIGMTVIADKKGFDRKTIIIGNFCKNCRNPFNDSGTICYNCNKEESKIKNGLYYGGLPGAIISDYNKCNNCCNLFKYNEKNDEYCNDCIDSKINKSFNNNRKNLKT